MLPIAVCMLAALQSQTSVRSVRAVESNMHRLSEPIEAGRSTDPANIDMGALRPEVAKTDCSVVDDLPGTWR